MQFTTQEDGIYRQHMKIRDTFRPDLFSLTLCRCAGLAILFCTMVPMVAAGHARAVGNKEDVRRLWLLDKEGRVLCATAAGKLSATALHYTTKQLDDAWRLGELKPVNEIVLSLDYAKQGLGNGSCGTAITMEEYQLKRMDRYEFGFTLQPAK